MKFFACLFAFSAFTFSAFAHSEVKDEHVAKRMELMSAMAAQTKLLGGMMKKQIEFDALKANAALSSIAELAAATPEAFETQATDPKSEAKAIIWEEFEAFTKLAEELEAKAEGANIEAHEDIKGAMMAIGASCKACHSEYRE